MTTADIIWAVATLAFVYIPYLRDPRIHELPNNHGIPAECITQDWY